MLTKVRLDGVMGKKFGKEWELDVSSPAEALRLIDVNKPGLKNWIVENREKYDAYHVVCTYHDGREESLDDNTFPMQRNGLKSIRFTPAVAGAKAVAKVFVGAIMIAIAYFVPGPWSPYLYKMGASLILSGVIEMLSPRPKTKDGAGDGGPDSYYFDGPANTERQGNPVPLIYGRVLVGAHPISASISIDEVGALNQAPASRFGDLLN